MTKKNKINRNKKITKKINNKKKRGILTKKKNKFVKTINRNQNKNVGGMFAVKKSIKPIAESIKSRSIVPSIGRSISTTYLQNEVPKKTYEYPIQSISFPKKKELSHNDLARGIGDSIPILSQNSINKIIQDSLKEDMLLKKKQSPFKHYKTFFGKELDNEWRNLSFIESFKKLKLDAYFEGLLDAISKNDLERRNSQAKKLFYVISNYIDILTDPIYHLEQDEFGRLKFKKNLQEQGLIEREKFKYEEGKRKTYEDDMNYLWDDFKLERAIFEFFRQSQPKDWDWYVDQVNILFGAKIPFLFKVLKTPEQQLKISQRQFREQLKISNQILNDAIEKIIQNMSNLGFEYDRSRIVISLNNPEETEYEDKEITIDPELLKPSLIDITSIVIISLMSDKLNENILAMLDYSINFNKTKIISDESDFFTNFPKRYIESLVIQKNIQEEYEKEVELLLNSIKNLELKEKVIEENNKTSTPESMNSVDWLELNTNTPEIKDEKGYLEWFANLQIIKSTTAISVAASKVGYAMIKYGINTSVEIGSTTVSYSSIILSCVSSVSYLGLNVSGSFIKDSVLKNPIQAIRNVPYHTIKSATGSPQLANIATSTVTLIGKSNLRPYSLLGYNFPLLNRAYNVGDFIAKGYNSGLIDKWTSFVSALYEPKTWELVPPGEQPVAWDEFIKKMFIALEPTLEIFLNDLVKQDCTVFIKENLKYIIPNKITLSSFNRVLELGDESMRENTNIFCKQIIPVIISQLKNKGLGEGLLNEESNLILDNYLKNNMAAISSIMSNNIKEKFSEVSSAEYFKKSINIFIDSVKEKYISYIIDTNSYVSSIITPQINNSDRRGCILNNTSPITKNDTALSLEVNIKDELIKIGDLKNTKNLYTTIEKLLELYDKEVNEQLKDQNQATRTSALVKIIDLRLNVILKDICSFLSKESQPVFCNEKILKIIEVFTDIKKENYSGSDMIADLSYIFKQLIIDVSIESFPYLIDDVLNSNKKKSALMFEDLGLNTDEIQELEKPSYLEQYSGLTFMLDMEI